MDCGEYTGNNPVYHQRNRGHKGHLPFRSYVNPGKTVNTSVGRTLTGRI